MSDCIFLDKIPDFPPEVPVKEGEKWIKHVYCGGSRFHVISYIGTINGVIRKCSEPNCIINKKEDA